MIIIEEVKINGKSFNKTYSDKVVMIERNGSRYSEAIDPIEFKDRIYEETDEVIIIDEEEK